RNSPTPDVPPRPLDGAAAGWCPLRGVGTTAADGKRLVVRLPFLALGRARDGGSECFAQEDLRSGNGVVGVDLRRQDQGEADQVGCGVPDVARPDRRHLLTAMPRSRYPRTNAGGGSSSTARIRVRSS